MVYLGVAWAWTLFQKSSREGVESMGNYGLFCTTAAQTNRKNTKKRWWGVGLCLRKAAEKE